MTIKEMLGIGLVQYPDKVEVNPTEVVEHEEFCDSGMYTDDYKSRAIDKLLKAGVGFCSTSNNTWLIFERYIKVSCPYCGTNMVSADGSGSSSEMTMRYKCPQCKMAASITVDANAGIVFRPKER